MVLTIEQNRFGAITTAGKARAHDVLIRLSEDIKNRRQQLSKRVSGISHILPMDETKYTSEKGCAVIIDGSGQHDSLRLSPKADTYFKK